MLLELFRLIFKTSSMLLVQPSM